MIIESKIKFMLVDMECDHLTASVIAQMDIASKTYSQTIAKYLMQFILHCKFKSQLERIVVMTPHVIET